MDRSFWQEAVTSRMWDTGRARIQIEETLSMRKWCGLFLAGAAALLVAAPGSAVMVPFSATSTLELGAFPPVSDSATGLIDATTTGGAVTGFTIPKQTFNQALDTPVVPPAVLVKGVA